MSGNGRDSNRGDAIMSRPARYYDDLLEARGRDKSSTCYLFLQDVKPLSEWEVLTTVIPKKSAEERALARFSLSKSVIRRWHERFAPHLETIQNMLCAGARFRDVGKEIDMSGEAVRKYVVRNPEKFDLKNESV